MRTWLDIPPGTDAILKPAEGSDILCIIYINECANNGNGSFEIEHLDPYTVKEVYDRSLRNASMFFVLLPDYYNNRWYYCDNTPERETEFNGWVDEYFNADFIVGRDGGIEEEFQYIMNWASKRLSEEE